MLWHEVVNWLLQPSYFSCLYHKQKIQIFKEVLEFILIWDHEEIDHIGKKTWSYSDILHVASTELKPKKIWGIPCKSASAQMQRQDVILEQTWKELQAFFWHQKHGNNLQETHTTTVSEGIMTNTCYLLYGLRSFRDWNNFWKAVKKKKKSILIKEQMNRMWFILFIIKIQSEFSSKFPQPSKTTSLLCKQT